MLYVSKIIDKNTIEITNTTTKQISIEAVDNLYDKYGKTIVEGLTFTVKKKKPKIVVITPALLVLQRIPVGQVFLLKLNDAVGFEHCIVLGHNKDRFKLYRGGGQSGLFVLTRKMCIILKANIVVDVVHVDATIAKLLKEDYKKYF